MAGQILKANISSMTSCDLNSPHSFLISYKFISLFPLHSIRGFEVMGKISGEISGETSQSLGKNIY